jgi:hypothetical protein
MERSRKQLALDAEPDEVQLLREIDLITTAKTGLRGITRWVAPIASIRVSFSKFLSCLGVALEGKAELHPQRRQCRH